MYNRILDGHIWMALVKIVLTADHPRRPPRDHLLASLLWVVILLGDLVGAHVASRVVGRILMEIVQRCGPCAAGC